jgi:hypothetical protein
MDGRKCLICCGEVAVVLFLELALFVFKFAAFSLLGNYSVVFWPRRTSTLSGTTIILSIDLQNYRRGNQNLISPLKTPNQIFPRWSTTGP